uniref:Uncharacterized protein n=1 Tax=Oryza brachyantha TaxID=4533 RepID=J3LHR7_ORYBR
MQAFLKCEGSSNSSLAEANLTTNFDNMSPKCWEASLENSVGRMSTAKQITPLPSMSSWHELVEGSYLDKGLSIEVLLFTNSMEPPISQVISEIPTKGQPFFISCCNWSMLSNRGNLLSQYMQFTV